ncbi:MAG: beta-glucosidase [Patescibacteria group bacterium]|nr:beta-glucosidase [Patescibacteria group bacterium]
MVKPIFPKSFYWGASTAGHQVEGGLHDDWTVWELAHAKELAGTAPKRLNWLPNWDDIKSQATEPDNYVSGKGVDHYNRYKEDFDLLEDMNMNAFRFSIEWARLETEEGVWDEDAVAHYRDYLAELRRRKIEPFLNIWHWTVPNWFQEKGAFAKRTNLKYFLRFVQKISDEYGADLGYIITLNEPNVYMSLGFVTATRPPQEKNFWKAFTSYWNLHSAHKQSYKLLKKAHPHLQVGIAAQLGNIQAKRPHNIIDESVTKVMRYAWNWWFLRRTRNQQDFIGINYYFTDYYQHFKPNNPKVPLNDLGWYMEPEGVYPLLLRAWARYKKPIFITENGVADSHDQFRRWWIEETVVAMERALSEGVDLRGYFHWSLLDNFEWEAGWWPKFGLVAVDRKNGMKRSLRPSAKWFGELIKQLR